MDNAEQFAIGARTSGGGTSWSLYFIGLIDEVRMSKGIARSAAWAKAAWETGRDHLLDFGSEEGIPAGGVAPTGVLYGSLIGSLGGPI